MSHKATTFLIRRESDTCWHVYRRYGVGGRRRYEGFYETEAQAITYALVYVGHDDIEVDVNECQEFRCKVRANGSTAHSIHCPKFHTEKA